MKEYLIFVLVTLWLVGCSKDDTPPRTPIAPIIKEIQFPSENESLPTSIVKIMGKGFSPGDILRLINETNTVVVDVIEVTDHYISFRIPKEAEGVYIVQLERDNKTAILFGELTVPSVVVIEDLEVPGQIFARGETVVILGEGFENGDKLFLSNTNYGNVEIEVTPTVSSQSVSFVLPNEVYGINKLIVKRGQKMSVLGEIKIAVSPGDKIGGGIVYYVSNDGLHGLITALANVGTPLEMWGPAVSQSEASGTSQDLGSGRSNTTKLIAAIARYRSNNPGSTWNNIKTAAELCTELTVQSGQFTFTDWFLPSRAELIELFKSKNLLASEGVSIPANNYWTSSEGDGNAAGWSAYYVNFYEATQIVSGNSDKEGWKIGIRPIRSF